MKYRHFQFSHVIFLLPLEAHGHAIPHFKALRYGKDYLRVSCGSTYNICQDFLKSENLLHEKGFVDSRMKTTVQQGTVIPEQILIYDMK